METRPWAPASDEELTWFRPGGIFPSRPQSLEYSLEIYGLTFGLTHALVSLNFPLYEVRSQLFDGELYLATVPSGLWERDPKGKERLLWDSSLRFTRNIRGPWERDIRNEVLGYSSWMSEAMKDHGDPDAALKRLRRIRGTQWYALMRAVVGPVAMLQSRVRELPADSPDRSSAATIAQDGAAVLREGLGLVREEGRTLLNGVVERVGQQLADLDRLDAGEDAWWLAWAELRAAASEPGHWPARVAERKAASQTRPQPPAELIGPDLPADAPHMYLVRDVLALLAS